MWPKKLKFPSLIVRKAVLHCRVDVTFKKTHGLVQKTDGFSLACWVISHWMALIDILAPQEKNKSQTGKGEMERTRGYIIALPATIESLQLKQWPDGRDISLR